MRNFVNFMAAVFVVICFALGAVSCSVLNKAFAQFDEMNGVEEHDPAPHERYHEFYKTWKQPDNPAISCCNANKYDTLTGKTHISGDCEPTHAELRPGADGLVHWWARVPEWMIKEGMQPWIEIPDSKVIHERNPTGEEAHLCVTALYHLGSKVPTPNILCFSPPDTGG